MSQGTKKAARAAVAVLAVTLAGSVLTGCRAASTISRPTTPVVLTGAQLPSLVGTAAGRVVAFRHNERGDGTGRAWTQVPVQVDQRKVVAFGTQPADNTVSGVTGTVYGTPATSVTALQYADPGTWVGADPNPALDADDEVVFMASDAGGELAPDVANEPAGVMHHSGVAVRIADPRASSETGWVYLFASAGSLDPSAGRDYVDYRFTLASGAYKTSYRRRTGPNPETSGVTTAAYEIGFSDRWLETSWKVRAPRASGVDILDGHKNQFAVNSCGRSNVTFAAEEGAFVANIDGPVRAIRSYVGANSGPLTQRTHLMYRDRVDVVTNLRVHAIPAIMDFLDYSSAAKTMTYRSSTKPSGVPIDGNADAVSVALPTWEAVSGAQGHVLTRSTYTSDIPPGVLTSSWFYRDQTSPPEQQCWGDGSFLGANGANITGQIPNTDPSAGSHATLTSRRTTEFAAPAADPSAIPAAAADWSADLARPLTTTVTRYRP